MALLNRVVHERTKRALRGTRRHLRVAAGKLVTLTLRNDGFIPHDFSLTDASAPSVKVSAGPLGTSSATFTVERAGTYTFICSVQGHADAGMRGTIVVE